MGIMRSVRTLGLPKKKQDTKVNIKKIMLSKSIDIC